MEKLIRIENQKLLLKIRKLIHEFPMRITLYEDNSGQPYAALHLKRLVFVEIYSYILKFKTMLSFHSNRAFIIVYLFHQFE